MQASPGDRIIIKAHKAGAPDRDAEVLEVRGRKGSPPWLIRWKDTGHEGLLFPGTDTQIQHFDGHGRA